MQHRGFRSSITTQGRRMAGARALWRATGMKKEDFQKPIIAIANSFAQFVPGHVHLHEVGRKRPVSAALQAYAALTTSAARGAVRDVTQA